MPIPIYVVAGLAGSLSRGNFGARVDGERLLVPPILGTILLENRLTTAEGFVSFAHSFPTALAQPLGWSPDDVMQALYRLTPLLRGLVSRDILNPPSPPKRGYGALNPVLLEGVPSRYCCPCGRK